MPVGMTGQACFANNHLAVPSALRSLQAKAELWTKTAELEEVRRPRAFISSSLLRFVL